MATTGPSESKTSERRIDANTRHKQALELRMAGYDYRTIADKSALKKTLQEPADKVRELEIKRLDAMLAAIWARVRSGNDYAIDRALKIMARRAEYLGLDAPKEVRIAHELQPMADRIGADMGLDPADILAEAERIVAAAGVTQ